MVFKFLHVDGWTVILGGPPQGYQSTLNVKGKVILLQAWCGPEGGKMYNSTLP